MVLKEKNPGAKLVCLQSRPITLGTSWNEKCKSRRPTSALQLKYYIGREPDNIVFSKAQASGVLSPQTHTVCLKKIWGITVVNMPNMSQPLWDVLLTIFPPKKQNSQKDMFTWFANYSILLFFTFYTTFQLSELGLYKDVTCFIAFGRTPHKDQPQWLYSVKMTQGQGPNRKDGQSLKLINIRVKSIC